MTAPRFKDGVRVRLKPFEDEPEQFGVILGDEDNGVYMVRLDRRYRDGKYDDGLREVTVDQMEVAPR